MVVHSNHLPAPLKLHTSISLKSCSPGIFKNFTRMWACINFHTNTSIFNYHINDLFKHFCIMEIFCSVEFNLNNFAVVSEQSTSLENLETSLITKLSKNNSFFYYNVQSSIRYFDINKQKMNSNVVSYFHAHRGQCTDFSTQIWHLIKNSQN